MQECEEKFEESRVAVPPKTKWPRMLGRILFSLCPPPRTPPPTKNNPWWFKLKVYYVLKISWYCPFTVIYTHVQAETLLSLCPPPPQSPPHGPFMNRARGRRSGGGKKKRSPRMRICCMICMWLEFCVKLLDHCWFCRTVHKSISVPIAVLNVLPVSAMSNRMYRYIYIVRVCVET